MRHIHEIPKLTPRQLVLEALERIQILCAREAPLERIHDEAEQAIEILNSRH